MPFSSHGLHETPGSAGGRRPRLLLVAYLCSPCRGSEQGVGWQRAVQAARFMDTWVLCKQQRSEEDIARFLAENGPIPGLRFSYLPLTAPELLLKDIPGFYYLVYHLWQRRAYRRALALHRELAFDLAHQVTIGSFREPGYLWKLGIPFLWGPIGGTQNYPAAMFPMAGPRGTIAESARTLLNRLQLRLTPRIRKAVARADILLAANSTGVRDLERRFHRRATLELDVGCTALGPDKPPRGQGSERELRILWSGVFGHRKALHILLHALAGVGPPPAYTLRILGSGPLERRWRRLARRLGVERRCQWLGWLTHAEAHGHYLWADVFAFTSLRDTCGTVVLEALSNGVPVICLDHQGAGDVVTPSSGVKIPVTDPATVIRGFRQALIDLGTHPARLDELSRGARERAREYLWDRKGEKMAALYRSVIAARVGSGETR
jgi:glycosyltransferase involved in cell wall biosynthesis